MSQNKNHLLILILITIFCWGCMQNYSNNRTEIPLKLSYCISTNEENSILFMLENMTDEVFFLQEPEMNVGIGYHIEYTTIDDIPEYENVDTVSQIWWSKFICIPPYGQYGVKIRMKTNLCEIKHFDKVSCIFRGISHSKFLKDCKSYDNLVKYLVKNTYEIVGDEKEINCIANSKKNILNNQIGISAKISSIYYSCKFYENINKKLFVTISTATKTSLLIYEPSDGIEYDMVYETIDGKINTMMQRSADDDNSENYIFRILEGQNDLGVHIVTQSRDYTIKLPVDLKKILKIEYLIKGFPIKL